MRDWKDACMKLIDQYRDDMVEFIDYNWPGGENDMDSDEAEVFLGHSVEDMDQDDIDEEVSEIQKSYYICGGCDDEELLDKFLEIVEGY